MHTYEMEVVTEFLDLGGGYCNFMHLKHVPRSLRRKLMKKMYEANTEYKVNRQKELEGLGGGS